MPCSHLLEFPIGSNIFAAQIWSLLGGSDDELRLFYLVDISTWNPLPWRQHSMFKRAEFSCWALWIQFMLHFCYKNQIFYQFFMKRTFFPITPGEKCKQLACWRKLTPNNYKKHIILLPIFSIFLHQSLSEVYSQFFHRDTGGFEWLLDCPPLFLKFHPKMKQPIYDWLYYSPCCASWSREHNS